VTQQTSPYQSPNALPQAKIDSATRGRKSPEKQSVRVHPAAGSASLHHVFALDLNTGISRGLGKASLVEFGDPPNCGQQLRLPNPRPASQYEMTGVRRIDNGFEFCQYSELLVALEPFHVFRVKPSGFGRSAKGAGARFIHHALVLVHEDLIYPRRYGF